jgi:membrane-associated phospholipid phosphatase
MSDTFNNDEIDASNDSIDINEPVSMHANEMSKKRSLSLRSKPFVASAAALGVVIAAAVFAVVPSSDPNGKPATRRDIPASAVAYDLVVTLNEQISRMRLAAPEASRLYGYTFFAAYTAAAAVDNPADAEVAAASAGAETASRLIMSETHAASALTLGPRHGTDVNHEAAALGRRVAIEVVRIADNDVYRAGIGQWSQKEVLGTYDYVTTGRGEPPLEPNWGQQPTIITGSSACELPTPDVVVIEAQARAMYESFTKTTALGNDVFWWLAGNGTATPTGQWMRMAMLASQDANLNPAAALAMLTIAAISTADVGVVGWREKFRHNLVRPESMWQRLYGENALTLPRETPNHPSYPSGHSFFGGAVATTLIDIVGDVSVRDTLPADLYAPAEARTWPTMSAALAEAGLSRVHAGFHYPLDITAGQDLGACVARAVTSGLDAAATKVATQAG